MLPSGVISILLADHFILMRTNEINETTSWQTASSRIHLTSADQTKFMCNKKINLKTFREYISSFIYFIVCLTRVFSNAFEKLLQ